MGQLESGKTGKNDVIVTVYEESPRVRSLVLPQGDRGRVTKTNQRRTFGYDRRAELLAHVHLLRNGGLENVDPDPSPTEPIPKPKKKRRLLAPLRKIRFSISRIFGERKKTWRYESIGSPGHGRKYKLCCPKKRNWSNFSKKFCRVVRQFTCFWKCNKFSGNEEHQQLDSQMVDKSYVSR